MAGTLFEAAPFVLIAAVLPTRFAGLAGVAGCGCGGRRLPAALAPVAIAVCWLSFGPAVAIVRAIASLALAVLARGRRPRWPPHADPAPSSSDPFGELAAIATCSALAFAMLPLVSRVAASVPESVVLGALLGVFAPCATAGVAFAAAAAGHAPFVAVAILATSGIVPRPRPFARPVRPAMLRDDRFAAASLGIALALLAARGPSGLVHPRLVPVVALGAIAAASYAVRRRPIRMPVRASVVPAVMLAALVAGSPQPAYDARDAAAASGFPGEAATFTGVLRPGRVPSDARLVRFAITCCRIDAAAVVMPLDRRPNVPDGTWIEARGALELRNGAVALRANAWRALPEPRDPFVYR